MLLKKAHQRKHEAGPGVNNKLRSGTSKTGQSWDQTHRCGAVWSAVPTSGSAKPIKNAKIPWSLPKAKLQSFLIFSFFFFFTWLMPSYPTPQQAQTTRRRLKGSQLFLPRAYLKLVLLHVTSFGRGAVRTLKGWHRLPVATIQTALVF